MLPVYEPITIGSFMITIDVTAMEELILYSIHIEGPRRNRYSKLRSSLNLGSVSNDFGRVLQIAGVLTEYQIEVEFT